MLKKLPKTDYFKTFYIKKEYHEQYGKSKNVRIFNGTANINNRIVDLDLHQKTFKEFCICKEEDDWTIPKTTLLKWSASCPKCGEFNTLPTKNSHWRECRDCKVLFKCWYEEIKEPS